MNCSLPAPVHWVSHNVHPTKATLPLHFSDLKRALLSQGCLTCCHFSLVCTFSQHSLGLSAHQSGFSANIINFPTEAFLKQCSPLFPFSFNMTAYIFTHYPPLPFLSTVHYVKLSKLWFMCLFIFCLLHSCGCGLLSLVHQCMTKAWHGVVLWCIHFVWMNKSISVSSNGLKLTLLVNERIQALLVSPTSHFQDMKIDKLVNVSKFCFFCFQRLAMWSNESEEGTKTSGTGCDWLIVNTTIVF